MAATLEQDGWELEDVEAAHARNPATFQIPSPAERRGLQRGDTVKLVFLFRCEEDGEPYVQGERMHVTIRQKTGRRYSGVLADAPASSAVLRLGDRVAFGPQNVATVLVSTNEP